MRNLFLIRDASVNLSGDLTESCDNSGKYKIEQVVEQMYDIISKQMQEISYKKSKNGLYLLYSPEPVAKQTAEIIKDRFRLKLGSFDEEKDLWIDEKEYLENAFRTINKIITLHEDYLSIAVCANKDFIRPYKNYIFEKKSIKKRGIFQMEKGQVIHFDFELGTYKLLFG